MIHFLFIHLFYQKKIIILMISLFLIILLMVLFIYTDESIADQLLYRAYNHEVYHLMMGKIVSFLMPFLVTVLLMDHDQGYLKPLFAYFNRSKVIRSKMILYFWIVTWFYLVIGIFYHLLPSIMTSYYLLNAKALPFLIDIYLDGLILSVLILWIVKERYKTFSILIPLGYILISWLFEDYQFITLYYFFPIYSAYFLSFTLAYLYKLCYILLGLAITNELMLREEIK